MLLSDLLKTLAGGWSGEPTKMWGNAPLDVVPEDTSESYDTPVDLPLSKPVHPDELAALASRDRAVSTTTPLPTETPTTDAPTYDTTAGRQAIDASLAKNSIESTPVYNRPSGMSRPMEADYNIYGEDRATAEHGLKGRLKQIGRGALLGLQNAQAQQPGGYNTLGSVLGRALGGAAAGALGSAIRPAAAGEMYQRQVVAPRERANEAYDYARKEEEAKLGGLQTNEALKQAQIGHTQAEIDALKAGKTQTFNRPEGIVSVNGGTASTIYTPPEENLEKGEDGFLHRQDGSVYTVQGRPVPWKEPKATKPTPYLEDSRTAEAILQATEGVPESITADTIEGRPNAGRDQLPENEKGYMEGRPTVIPPHTKPMTVQELHEWQKSPEGKQMKANDPKGYAQFIQQPVRQIPQTETPPTEQEKSMAAQHAKSNMEEETRKVYHQVKGEYQIHKAAAVNRLRELKTQGYTQEDAEAQLAKEIQDKSLYKNLQSVAPAKKAGGNSIADRFYNDLITNQKKTPEQAKKLVKMQFPDYE